MTSPLTPAAATAETISLQGAGRVHGAPTLPVLDRKACEVALAGAVAAARAMAQIPPMMAIVTLSFVMAFPRARTAAQRGCSHDATSPGGKGLFAAKSTIA